MRSFFLSGRRRTSSSSCITGIGQQQQYQQRLLLWDRSSRTSSSSSSLNVGRPFSGGGGGGGVVSASSPHSSQSYFERHSRLFSTTPKAAVSSDLSNIHNNNNDEGDKMNDLPGENNLSEKVQKYSDYEKWVRRLYMTNLFHPVKMGLSNMQQLHDIMGNPMDDVSDDEIQVVAGRFCLHDWLCRFGICTMDCNYDQQYHLSQIILHNNFLQPKRLVVHVAGTNGKGSVCLKIANALQRCNLRVGLFCSPHVSSFRERMQVNVDMIREDEVVELLPQIYDWCAKEDIPATFFEITTALAFLFYAKRETEVVVLETGLGGRLDATNVIKTPAISIITSIGLEHTRILGDTVELIAAEKGGIIKEGRPVLVGPHCPQDVLQQCAREKNAGRYYNPGSILKDYRDFDIADYDEENSRIAKAALILLKNENPDLLHDLTEDVIDDAITIRPPCRFEQVQREDGLTILLDVAHNPPAMIYLVEKLRTTYPDSQFRFVAGMSSDKDIGQCSRTLLSIADPEQIHLVEAAHPRAASLPSILIAEPRLVESHYDLDDRSITTQVQAAVNLAKERNEVLVICGSVFLMAETREALGFDEPRDSEYIAEMAGAGVRHGQENFGNTTMSEDTADK